MRDNHIVYATDQNYVFLCAVSIASLLDNKNEDDRYIIHILSDGSVIDDDKALFERLEEIYDKCLIVIHDYAHDVLDNAIFVNPYYNKMTLYRLMLPDILSDVERCVYLDSDTMVCGDIGKLLDYDVTDYYLAAVKDCDITKVYYENVGNLDLTDYFNAGVLLMNLEKLRNDKMIDEFLPSLDMHWFFNDQDILNKTCKDKVLYVDRKYNCFSYLADEHNLPIVVHFLGQPGMRPWIYKRARLCDIWWHYADIFSDTQSYNKIKSDVDKLYNDYNFQMLLGKCKAHKNVYVFGGGFLGRKVIHSLVLNRINNIQAVLDNKLAGQDKYVAGYPVISIDDVDNNLNNLFVVTVINESIQNDIKQQLIDYGIDEESIHIYIEYHPDYYTYIDPKYAQEEKDDIILRECGRGTDRTGWK